MRSSDLFSSVNSAERARRLGVDHFLLGCQLGPRTLDHVAARSSPSSASPPESDPSLLTRPGRTSDFLCIALIPDVGLDRHQLEAAKLGEPSLVHGHFFSAIPAARVLVTGQALLDGGDLSRPPRSACRRASCRSGSSAVKMALGGLGGRVELSAAKLITRSISGSSVDGVRPAVVCIFPATVRATNRPRPVSRSARRRK